MQESDTIDVTSAAPREVLRSVFGYEDFRPAQEEIIDRLVRGKHALVIMPTGGGKSLCYQIPAMVRQGVGIIVSPLISLMQDQVEALRQLGVRAAFLNSSLEYGERREIKQQLSAGELDLLYVAPERLMSDRFIHLLEQVEPTLFAIDEVHCMSKWGHDFRPDYLELASICERLPHVPCIAVTATADTQTQADILQRLDLPEASLFVTGFDRPNICYRVVVKRSGKKQLARFLRNNHAGNAGIVYCLSRKKTEKTAAWLSDRGFDAVPYHAGLSADRRREHQSRFLREEGLIVVATVAFGMGIDKPDVRFVAHLDLPKSLEAYYQETGRAGRDGQPADAWMAYRYGDVVRMRQIMDDGTENDRHQWTQHHKLNAMLGYCETTDCRRKVLLNYFGEETDDGCGNCDICLNPVETWDGTVAAQKVLSCVARTGQRFGAGYITDVLLGRNTKKVRRFGHSDLSTYGIGDELNKSGWRSVVRQLVAKNLLRVDVGGYGALQLTDACEPVLKGEREVALRKDRKPQYKKEKRKATADTLPDTPEARDLFEALREVRTELARDQNVPPYVIFHDRTLRAMVEYRPRDATAFRQLSGVGDVKLERYGNRFMAVIRSYSAVNES
jgi:ATP-dependent DNA helicase RecQ